MKYNNIKNILKKQIENNVKTFWTFDEQEKIRLSILALRDLTKVMSSVGLAREQFVTAKIETPTEDSISDLAGELASNLAAMAHIEH